MRDPFTQRPRAVQLSLSDFGECATCRERAAEVEALRAEVARLREVIDFAALNEAKKTGKRRSDAKRVMENWRVYHRENPHVFNAILQIVGNQASEGVTHTTIRAIWEGLRTHTWLPGVTSQKEFRLPDHYLPLYVRLVGQYRPEFAPMFDRKDTCRFEGLDLIAFLKGDDAVAEDVGESARRTYGEIAEDEISEILGARPAMSEDFL